VGVKTYDVYCLYVNMGVSSGGWVNKVPASLLGDMGREGYFDAKSVLLLHCNQRDRCLVGGGDATGAFTCSRRS